MRVSGGGSPGASPAPVPCPTSPFPEECVKPILVALFALLGVGALLALTTTQSTSEPPQSREWWR
jgi:hypothetical protein